MGDKTAARRTATACGVSIVPGTNQALNSAEEAKEFAAGAGYPVILKASMGGGGRGMRVVREESEMAVSGRRRGLRCASLRPAFLCRNACTLLCEMAVSELLFCLIVEE